MCIKIAIVEDEEDLLELLEYSLSKENYEVIGFLDTKNVEQLLDEEDISLLIMDRNLPEVEGSLFVEELRKKGFDTPVIYLSAKDKENDVEEGFLHGGDDYITKPFNMKELVLRIKAILKRTGKNSVNEILIHRDITLNINSRTVNIDNQFIDITKLEFDLLHEFFLNKNRVLDRDYLLENVWKDSVSFQYRTVNVAINRIKEKIDPNKTKEYIETVRGVGYKIK